MKWQGYGLSAYEINREHARNTVLLESRRMKYLPWLRVWHADANLHEQSFSAVLAQEAGD